MPVTDPDGIYVDATFGRGGHARALLARLSPSPLPPGYFGHAPMEIPRYDPERAKRMLTEAGHPNGFTIKNYFISKSFFYPKVMTLAQEQLKKVGINVELQVVEHATFHENIRKNLNPFVLYGGTRITDADPWLSLFLQTVLVTFVVAGIETLVIGLLPMRFLPGHPLFQWRKSMWLPLFALAVFAYLLLRSRYVPRALAGLGIVASLLLSAYSATSIVFPAVEPYWAVLMAPMFLYEVTLGFWLLLGGFVWWLRFRNP